MSPGQALLSFARSRSGGFVARFAFGHLSSVLPLHRLIDTEHIIAFNHPSPMAPVHILIIPKKEIRDLVSLAQPHNAVWASAVFNSARQLGSKLDSDWTLFSNGGQRQDVAQVHFYLVSGDLVGEDVDYMTPQFGDSTTAELRRHEACTKWPGHFVCCLPAGALDEPGVVLDTLLTDSTVVTHYARTQGWFTLMFPPAAFEEAAGSMHLIGSFDGDTTYA